MGLNNDIRNDNQYFLGRDNVMRDTDSYSIGYNLAADSTNNFLFGYNNNSQTRDVFILGHDVIGKARENIAIGMNFIADRDSAIQLGITDPTLDIYRGAINIRRNTELQLDGNAGNPGEILMSNGGGSTPIWNSASSLGNINFLIGTAGSTPSITPSVTLGGTVALNIPNASATATGLLRSSDWTAFNNKIGVISGTPNGLSISGTGISLVLASSSVTGALSPTNFLAFS
jgi:hypothetical protein